MNDLQSVKELIPYIVGIITPIIVEFKSLPFIKSRFNIPPTTTTFIISALSMIAVKVWIAPELTVFDLIPLFFTAGGVTMYAHKFTKSGNKLTGKHGS